MFRYLLPILPKPVEKETEWPKHSIICDCRRCVKQVTKYIDNLHKKGKR